MIDQPTGNDADNEDEPCGSVWFGPFRFDLDRRLLYRDDAELYLPPRALAVLEALLQKSGEILCRDDLIAAAWRGLAVSDGALSEAIWLVRQALGDRSDQPRYLETVPRRGYRFIAPLRTGAPGPSGPSSLEQPPATLRPGQTWRVAIGRWPWMPGLLGGLAIVIGGLVWGFGTGLFRAGGVSSASAAAETLARAAAGAVLRSVTLPDGTPVEDMNAALSSDGNAVVFSDVSGTGLYVYRMDAGTVRRVISWPFFYQPLRLRWSPDGRRIAFDFLAPEEPFFTTRVLDLETGVLLELARSDRAHVTPIDWFPDSRRLLCLVEGSSGRQLVMTDGTGRAMASVPVQGTGFRLSPDGSFVAFQAGTGDSEVYVERLAWEPSHRGDTEAPGKPTETGTPVVVAPHPAADHAPIWSPDGRFLVFQSNRMDSWDLWGVQLAGGEPVGRPFLVRRNTGSDVGLNDWTASGRFLYAQRGVLNDVWILPVDPATATVVGNATLATPRVRGHNAQPAWMPDGSRIVFRSPRKGQVRLLSVRPDGTDERDLGVGLSFQNPAVGPDGGRVAFSAYRDGAMRLMEWNLAAGRGRVLLPDMSLGNTASPQYSADGRYLVFNRLSEASDGTGLYVYDGSTATRVPNVGEWTPARFSPDGHWIAYTTEHGVWRIRRDGTGKQRLAEVPAPGSVNGFISWSPDGRWIAYPRWDRRRPSSRRRSGREFGFELWAVAADGREQHPVAEDLEINPWGAAWSPDGTRIAVSASSGQNSLWVMEGFWPFAGGEQEPSGQRPAPGDVPARRSPMR